MKNTKVFLTKWKMLLLISEAVPDPGQKAGGWQAVCWSPGALRQQNRSALGLGSRGGSGAAMRDTLQGCEVKDLCSTLVSPVKGLRCTQTGFL